MAIGQKTRRSNESTRHWFERHWPNERAIAIKDDEVYLIEVNPRASRTVPLLQKQPTVRSPQSQRD